jgi:leader peptidase (prepilin peptidase)/N-methyltransferase
MRGADLVMLAMLALLCVCFAAVWFSDVRIGLIPDAFTIVPLGALSAYAAIHGEWGAILSSAAAFVAFGVLAAASHGRGIGWGDVKLAALGAAILGLPIASLAFAAAGAAVALGAWMRRQRGLPVPFGPYLISAIALAMWLPLAA